MLALFLPAGMARAAGSDGVFTTAVILRGSSNLVPLVQQVAERYMREHPNVRVVVSAGGTYRGYKALLDGTADIAMASSPQSEEARNLRTAESPQFVTTTVGRVAMVPIVHPSVSLSTLSTAQLHRVFSGAIDDMSELGVKNKAPLKVLIGPPTEGLTESWRTLVIGEEDHYTPRASILGMRERARRVAADPAAISFVSPAELDEKVKPVAVNGEMATDESVRAGRYELVAPLMLVTREETHGAVTDFVRYFLSVGHELRFPGFIAARADQAPGSPKR